MITRERKRSEKMKVLNADTDLKVASCYSLLCVLRPHLVQGEFVERVKRQQGEGYHLIYLRQNKRVVAAAGYRIQEFLSWGKVLYVDDLITAPAARGAGYGGALIDWLIATGRKNKCIELHLDSGYQRHDAHRLYLNKGMQLGCHHFSITLK